MTRNPYKYLDYYDFEDADIFFGREEETQRMVGEILSTRLLVLFSPSGSGKTSLINAGVRPQLEDMGYQTVYTRLESEPISAVCRAVMNALDFPCEQEATDLYEFLKKAAKKSDKPLVIFLDQFEEFFTVFREQHEKRKEFIEELAKIKYDDKLPVFIVLSLREDYFVNLHEFREAIPSIFQNNANLRLENFSDEEARRAIVEPLKAVNSGIEAELVDILIKDLKNSKPGIEPITLQIVCHTLWEKKTEETTKLNLAEYESCGGSAKILSYHVKNLLNKIPKRQHRFMVRIFEALKTDDNTKRFRSIEDLKNELKIKSFSQLAKMLNKLSDLHLFRCEEKENFKWYEFKHDYLIIEVNSWIQNIKDQTAKKRLIYAVTPGIIFWIFLLIWIIIEYNSFSAHFTDQKYENQQREVNIKRKLNPFKKIEVTTGILEEDLKDLNVKNQIKNGFSIGIGTKNNWYHFVDILSPVICGKFLYHIGKQDAAIDTLKRIINAENSNDRYQATTIIGKIGIADNRIIDDLLIALNDKESSIRCQAIEELGNIGKADDRLVNILVSIIKSDESENVRSKAAWALGNLNIVNCQVKDVLVDAMKDTSSLVRSQALEAIGKIGAIHVQDLDDLMALLKDESPSIRSQAVWALGKLDTVNSDVIEALITMLKDKEQFVRLQASEVLGKINSKNTYLINGLLASLKNWNSISRVQAAYVLGSLNITNVNVIDQLLTMLVDENPSVCYQAAWALGKIGSSDKKVIDALTRSLGHWNLDVSSQAAISIANLCVGNSQVISILLKSAKHKKWQVRSNSIFALGKLGIANTDVANALVIALEDKFPYVRFKAAEALGELGLTDDRAIEALISALNDESRAVRSQAVIALGKIDIFDNRIIYALISVLKNKNADIRSQAVWAFGNINLANMQVINELQKLLLNDEDIDVRSVAAESLGKHGKADKQVIDALMLALNDKFEPVQTQAAKALGLLLQSKSQTELLNFLKDHRSCYRTAGAQALARQDSISKDLLKKINKLKDNDKRPWVRLSAWEAYELIQQRLKDEEAANQFIQKADSLFKINKFWEAENQYQSAFDRLTKIIRIDSLKIAKTKFQQARCTANLKKLIPTLDHLEIAFQYDKNKAWRDTLRAEVDQKESDWAFMKDNWYLNEVLLK